MKLSIIIPAYNEEKRIENTLIEYNRFFKELKKNNILDFEILVVINNTQDKTEEIVKEYSKKISELRYLNFKQGGKGFAIKEGFRDSLKRNNDLIGFVDADMSTSPKEFYELVKNINNYGGLIASRYISGSKVFPKQTILRSIAGRVFNFLVRILFIMNYRDTQCGAKLFKRKAIEKILSSLSMTQWAFDIDLLYQAKKLKIPIKELPTKWQDKDKSKLNIKKTSIQMFFAIIQLRIIKSPFKRLLRPFKRPVRLLWRLVK